MFNIFKRKPIIKGSIKYHNLTKWWLKSFTDKERFHIEKIYSPMGSSENNILTQGEIYSTSETAISLLSNLAGWFSKKEDLYLGLRIIDKAEALINNKSDILDIHFLYASKLVLIYKERDKRGLPIELDIAIEACNKQLKYSKKVIKELKKQSESKFLPGHYGYQHLIHIREMQGKKNEAIKLASRALKEGWSGAWKNDIDRLKKS